MFQTTNQMIMARFLCKPIPKRPWPVLMWTCHISIHIPLSWGYPICLNLSKFHERKIGMHHMNFSLSTHPAHKKVHSHGPCRLVIVYHGLTNPGEKYIVWSCWIWSFPKMGIPPVIIHVRRILPYKPSILGYPHFRKPPYDVIIWFIFQYIFQIFHVCFLNTIQLRKNNHTIPPSQRFSRKRMAAPDFTAGSELLITYRSFVPWSRSIPMIFVIFVLILSPNMVVSINLGTHGYSKQDVLYGKIPSRNGS